MFVGKTSCDDVSTDEWQSRTVTSELHLFPSATHLVAAVQGEGDLEAWFDEISITAKPAK
jgi:hypothetical protein